MSVVGAISLSPQTHTTPHLVVSITHFFFSSRCFYTFFTHLLLSISDGSSRPLLHDLFIFVHLSLAIYYCTFPISSLVFCVSSLSLCLFFFQCRATIRQISLAFYLLLSLNYFLPPFWSHIINDSNLSIFLSTYLACFSLSPLYLLILSFTHSFFKSNSFTFSLSLPSSSSVLLFSFFFVVTFLCLCR